jgi:N-methylhydantoinase B
MPISLTHSCVYACVRSVLDPSIPTNSGFMRPIHLHVEPGTIVNPTCPAPVAARGLTAMRTTEAVWGALARMLPHKVFACGVQGDFGVTIAGYRPGGQPFVHLEFLFGTWGGRPTKDGIDALSSLAVNYSNSPVEVLEGEQPLRIERYAFRTDSGGPGKHRGGLGMEREYRLVDVDEAVLQVRSDRQQFRPYGLQGGQSGAAAQNLLNAGTPNEQHLPGKFMMTLRRGATYRAVLAGGGGWGDPLDRDPEAVLDDVRNEKVSSEAARADYGVVVDLHRMVVDHEATEELRCRQRAARTPS